jgi:hypothetical protein
MQIMQTSVRPGSGEQRRRESLSTARIDYSGSMPDVNSFTTIERSYQQKGISIALKTLLQNLCPMVVA